MTDTLSCPECGETVDSAAELEAEHDVQAVELNDDDSLSLYGNRDLFLCASCGNPLGVSRS